jgi:hypothetical protein
LIERIPGKTHHLVVEPATGRDEIEPWSSDVNASAVGSLSREEAGRALRRGMVNLVWNE